MVIPDRPTDPTAIRDWLLRQSHQAKIRERIEAQERGEQPATEQIAPAYQIRKLREQKEREEQGYQEEIPQPQDRQRSRFAQSSRESVVEGNPDYTHEIQHPGPMPYIPQIGPSRHSLKRHHPGSQGGGEKISERNGNKHGRRDRRYFNCPQNR